MTTMPPPSLLLAGSLGLAGLLACAHGSQRKPAAAPPQPAPAAPATSASAPAQPVQPDRPKWLMVDSAAATITLALEVTARDSGPAVLNGYRAGQARIVIPRDWTIRWDWRNADSTSAHSLVVMVQREKIPLEAGRPAFSNAMTRMASTGLPPGATDQTTFVADEAGWFWLLCGVPSHALEGEWLELRVDPEAKTASVRVR